MAKISDILKWNELVAWNERLPKEKRYQSSELVKIYNNEIEINTLSNNYIQILPKENYSLKKKLEKSF
ncbi:MAG: hypothetical protein QW051_00165 [Candidatus Aenigmatarchaeota archaeon]